MASATDIGRVLEPYRQYLRLLAGLHLDARLRGKLDASDVVQLTFLRACTTFETLRSREPGVVAAWLRTVLARTLADAVRDLERAKRDVRRERELADDLDRSNAGLAAWLAADQSSPSERAVINEQLLHLAEALLALPDDQRQAVVLKHCQGKTLLEICEILDRTPAAVAGLLRRGLAQLRGQLQPTPPESLP